jgi:hypothetical protein
LPEDAAPLKKNGMMIAAAMTGRSSRITVTLRQPIVPATVGDDLGLHLMRFALMEAHLPRAAVNAFLKDLENALDTFVTAMERYLASGAQAQRPHAELAIQHGIAVHRASLEWTRSALAMLSAPAPA